jgi:hypothetical protein
MNCNWRAVLEGDGYIDGAVIASIVVGRTASCTLHD